MDGHFWHTVFHPVTGEMYLMTQDTLHYTFVCNIRIKTIIPQPPTLLAVNITRSVSL